MAKAESKTILKAYSTVESKLPTLPLEDGQLIFVYDKKKIILDNHGVRTVYEQIQTIETEEQRNDLLAPIDSFYFVIETSILWRYSNGHWNQITTSPQEQIDRIVAEGTKQVKAVQDKGNEVLQSIPEDFQMQMESKLDKQQGVENKGKALVIGEDGNVAPGEVQSGGGDGIAIINTMSGESPLVIPDSAERTLERLELGGKTEQVSTRGVNLFDVSKVVSNSQVINNGNGSIKVIADESNNGFSANTPNTLKDYCPLLIAGQTYVLSANTASTTKQIYLKKTGTVWTYGQSVQITKEMLDSVVLFYSDVNKTSVISNIQIERGSTATAYEPYTGGKPSPRPEYPQEIKNSGRWNEEKQKYEVDVKVTGKNLFDMNKFIDTCNFTKNEDGTFVIDKRVERYDCFFPANTILSIEVLKVGDSSGAAVLELFYEDGKSMYIGFSQVGVKTFLIQKDVVYIKVLAYRKHEYKYIQLEKGNIATPYEPYKEQKLTLTSDRPITKWDRLVEQGGQIGWLYKSRKIEFDGSETFDERYLPSILYTLEVGKYSEGGIFCNYSNSEGIGKGNNVGSTISFRKATTYWNCENAQQFKEFLKTKKDEGNPLYVFYETISTEFIPLPQSEQNAIRALKTYYHTTVITVDGGEVDPDIKVTYTADTKNYVDNKFGKTINAMQTKLLELESRV